MMFHTVRSLTFRIAAASSILSSSGSSTFKSMTASQTNRCNALHANEWWPPARQGESVRAKTLSDIRLIYRRAFCHDGTGVTRTFLSFGNVTGTQLLDGDQSTLARRGSGDG